MDDQTDGNGRGVVGDSTDELTHQPTRQPNAPPDGPQVYEEQAKEAKAKYVEQKAAYDKQKEEVSRPAVRPSVRPSVCVGLGVFVVLVGAAGSQPSPLHIWSCVFVEC